jgi:CheY-like chemotaxis protein
LPEVEKMRILHVDDDPSIRAFFEKAIRSLGFDGEILAASTVEEAGGVLSDRSLRREGFSLVVLDLNLPDGSGLEVAGQIKTNPDTSSTPVIVLSAEEGYRIVSEAYALGINCYLSKIPEGGGMLQSVRALYSFWVEEATLPPREKGATAGALVRRAVTLEARHARFFTRIAHRFADDDDRLRYWLGLALQESNHANLLSFFENRFGEGEVSGDVLALFDEFMTRRELLVLEVEKRLDGGGFLASEDAYRLALDLELGTNHDALFLGMKFFLEKEKTIARMLVESACSHYGRIAEEILVSTDREDLTCGAEALIDRATQLQGSLQ